MTGGTEVAGLLLAVPASSAALQVGGTAVVATELVDRACAEFPAVLALSDRERLLVSAWLSSIRSARTRRSYLGDVRSWLAWLAQRQVDVLAAGRVHMDLWVGSMTGAEASSVCRRLSGVSSFYRYCARHDLVPGNPTVGVERPEVDPDHTSTVALDRDEARALIAQADADTGPQRLRTRVLARLLLHNALRVDEIAGADLDDLGTDRGHRVLEILGKGNRKAKVPLTPGACAALDEYLVDRAARAGVPVDQLTGPLVATRTGGRLHQSHLWELVRRLARDAGIAAWAQLSPHSGRHTAITCALDAGVPLRDAQDFARHRDPRTTRRYDRSRASLDRNAAYTVATYLA
jgi:site-specific recombinase XerD